MFVTLSCYYCYYTVVKLLRILICITMITLYCYFCFYTIIASLLMCIYIYIHIHMYIRVPFHGYAAIRLYYDVYCYITCITLLHYYYYDYIMFNVCTYIYIYIYIYMCVPFHGYAADIRDALPLRLPQPNILPRPVWSKLVVFF